MQNYRNNMSEHMKCQNGGRNMASNTVSPCPCNNKDDVMEGMPLAMAYVPWQEWKCLYEAEKGFQRGTIFEELDKPFRGMGGCRR